MIVCRANSEALSNVRFANKGACADVLLPSILGALLTMGESETNGSHYHHLRTGNFYIHGGGVPSTPMFLTVEHNGKTVFRCGIEHSGEIYVTFQRRGAWEADVVSLNAPQITVADFLNYWVVRGNA